MIGLLGNGGLNAPLYVYVSRWFDRRRGTALALISSGAYVAGVIWPSLFAWAIGMLRLATHHAAVRRLRGPGSPRAARRRSWCCATPPEAIAAGPAAVAPPRAGDTVLGLSLLMSRLGLLGLAGFLLLRADGHAAKPTWWRSAATSASPPPQGAAMLSVLLGCAFLNSRQFWGWLSDRIGGLAHHPRGVGVPACRHDRLPV